MNMSYDWYYNSFLHAKADNDEAALTNCHSMAMVNAKLTNMERCDLTAMYWNMRYEMRNVQALKLEQVLRLIQHILGDFSTDIETLQGEIQEVFK